MMNQNYISMECLHVPKVLFLNEKYKSLSNTAKLLYCILLDRLTYAGMNDWIDEDGDLYVLYPKNDMKQDLNCTRYRADLAIRELEEAKDLIYVMADSGKPNRFYVRDVRMDGMEEKEMDTLGTILDRMTEQERDEIFAKIAAVTKEITADMAEKGYISGVQKPVHTVVNVEEECCDPMDFRGYFMDEDCTDLDVEQIEADAGDFGDELALNISGLFSEDVVGLINYRDFLNEKYETLPKRTFMVMLETIVQTIGGSFEYVADMYACKNHRDARRIYLEELVMAFNSLTDSLIENKVTVGE